MSKIGIVGAGLSGLAIANRIKNSVVFESESRPGGLLRTETLKGYTFDTGGSHIIFSKDDKILHEILDAIGDYVEHRRRAYIFYSNRFIKYPFENGISMLPAEERFHILKDFVENMIKEKKEPKNLLEWFYYVFGREITDRYLKPYNEKIWKRDLEDISLEWVGGRIPNPPVDDVLRSAVGIETEGYTHQLKFFYPLKGGIETLARSLAKGADVRVSERVSWIEAGEGRVYVETTEGQYEFEKLVYTAPLTNLPKIMDCNEIKGEIQKLDYNSLTVVGLGVKGEVPDFHWLYFPQDDIIFHRIAFLSNYSPYMAPEGCSTVIAEISRRPGERISNACDRVIDNLADVGFDFNVEVCGTWEWEHAYIVYNHHYREAVERIRAYLRERNVIPFGRFGGWEYLNMDEVMAKAKALAASVIE
uniref:FAD-dependent oxidoreductase n=1 Tax=Archaeoglobus fulgidus TaxID=2234 RepID=A0A7C3MFM2_ARCFL